ncbi:hypothetical protein CB1_000655010 [Camelus ferus]|nr:hypothetical protein CB1_000655010 [Camelus ferus]
MPPEEMSLKQHGGNHGPGAEPKVLELTLDIIMSTQPQTPSNGLLVHGSALSMLRTNGHLKGLFHHSLETSRPSPVNIDSPSLTPQKYLTFDNRVYAYNERQPWHEKHQFFGSKVLKKILLVKRNEREFRNPADRVPIPDKLCEPLLSPLGDGEDLHQLTVLLILSLDGCYEMEWADPA